MTAKEIRDFFVGIEEHAAPLQERYNEYLKYKRDLEERARNRRSSHEFDILEEYPKPVITVREMSETEFKHDFVSQVFLDEVNTSSCLGLLKEIVIDRSIEGRVSYYYMFI